MQSNDDLKIANRSIFIKHPNKRLAIFTVKKKIYGFSYDNKQIHTTQIRYDDSNPEKAIQDYIFEITKNNESYNNQASYNDISTQRTEYIIKKLKIAIANNRSHGDLDEANALEKATIISILEENNLPNPFKKNTKDNNEKLSGTKKFIKNPNDTEINYLFLLNQLVTGFKPTLGGKKEHVPKNVTLNEIAVVLKTRLGLKQELEIKGIHVKNLINDYYIKTEFNTMKKVSFEELYEISLKLLHGTDDITLGMETKFKRNDLEQILDYIPSDYRCYNKLTLLNGIYDLETHEFLNPEKIIERFGEPILTHKNVPFKYNPEAKGTKIKEILRYGFDKYNPEYNSEINEIKGFFEIGGYSLRSGNPEQKIVFMFGVANSSKSVLNNLITAIHGHRVSSLALEKFNDRFGISSLINKQLNTIRDIHNAIITDNSVIKISSGNEPLPFEPKGKTHGTIPAIEVPLSINSGNVLPRFSNPETAILRRLLNLEFNNRVPTATKIEENNVIEWNEDDKWIIDDIKAKENELGIKIPIPYVIKDLDQTIIKDNDEMEFLLYQFLKHDKTRIQENNHIFSIEKSHDEILKDLELYSNPVETLLAEIIEYDETIKVEKDSYDTIESVGVAVNELFEMLTEQARINHVDIPKSSNALGRKAKTAIKYLFDLDKNYSSKNSRWKLNLNNEIESCDQTKIYPKIKFKLLKTNKKHNK